MTSGDSPGADVRQFLRTRRARLTPEDAGLPDYGGRRRVEGLRREEVATLAGISIEYYNRMERGNVRGVSDEVVDSLSRALQLDDVEHAHLIDLIRAVNKSPTIRREPPQSEVRPALSQLLDAMRDAAAFLRTDRLEILAFNHLGAALYQPVLENIEDTPNLARFIFLDGASRRFYRDWDAVAYSAVGSLLTAAGQRPDDQPLSTLITELANGSSDFRSLWASHDVQYYRTGNQRFHHPVVGDIDLEYDALEIAADPGLTIVAYTAAPGTAAHDKLVELAAPDAQV